MEKKFDPERDGDLNRDDSATAKRPRKSTSSVEESAPSPFMRDKRPRIRRVTEQLNERTPQPRFEREGEERPQRRFDDRDRNDRQDDRPYRSYRPDNAPSDEPRRPYERRPDNAPEENRRRSFNPNFDQDNRVRRSSPRGDHRYESTEEDNRFNSYRYDRERETPREGNDRPRYNRPAYDRPDRNTRDNKPGYRNDRDDRNVRPKTADRRPPRPDNRRDGGKAADPFKTPKGGYDSEYKPKVYPAYAAANIQEPIRLNKYISMSGLCSRREADEFIRQGNITVNGRVVTEMGVKIAPTDEIHFNGELLQGEKRVYILMNKPKGFVTTVEDPNADRTVMDIVKNACKERVYPVGRLDKNSLGVLLITNDGELTKRLTHPSHEKRKVYQVSLDRPASQEDLRRLLDGVELEDGPARADELDFLSDSGRDVGISIHTGRNRIVRRMFEEIGYHVQKLDRVYFAGLTKKGLRRGAWRYLTPKEVAMVKSGQYE